MNLSRRNVTINDGNPTRFHEGNRLMWLPSVFVAVSLLTLLGLSFARYHRKIARKRRATIDYMLIQTQMHQRRTLSTLCNAYSIHMASSMRIRVPNALVCLKSVNSFNHYTDSSDLSLDLPYPPQSESTGINIEDYLEGNRIPSFGESESDYVPNYSHKPSRLNLAGIHNDESYERHKDKRKQLGRSFSFDEYWFRNKNLNCQDVSDRDVTSPSAQSRFICYKEKKLNHQCVKEESSQALENAIVFQKTSSRPSVESRKIITTKAKKFTPVRQSSTILNKRKRLTMSKRWNAHLLSRKTYLRTNPGTNSGSTKKHNDDQNIDKPEDSTSHITVSAKRKRLEKIPHVSKNITSIYSENSVDVDRRKSDLATSCPRVHSTNSLFLFSSHKKSEDCNDNKTTEDNNNVTLTKINRHKLTKEPSIECLLPLIRSKSGNTVSIPQTDLCADRRGQTSISLDLSSLYPLLLLLHQKLRQIGPEGDGASGHQAWNCGDGNEPSVTYPTDNVTNDSVAIDSGVRLVGRCGQYFSDTACSANQVYDRNVNMDVNFKECLPLFPLKRHNTKLDPKYSQTKSIEGSKGKDEKQNEAEKTIFWLDVSENDDTVV